MTWEIATNLVYLASILLATRNSWHTWWTGILGCLMFAWLFYQSQLYADVTLQGFFIVTSLYGWWHWVRGQHGEPSPIKRSTLREIALWSACAVIAALGYGALLFKFTDAYAPFVDSLVLTFSILAQLLLMRRRVETWWCWLIVNTISIPLYWSRGLELTAAFYAAYWINAWFGLERWRALLNDPAPASTASASVPQ